MERIIYFCALGALAVVIFFGLIRAIRGPRVADRIVGINIINTVAIAFIAILAVYMEEKWLLDVSIIYCMISFLTVVVLTKIHISVYRREEDDRHE